MQVLQGKIIVITGAASGIGAETARQLAAQGAVPILTGRSKVKLQQVSDTIGGKHGVYEMDVTDDAAVQSVIRTIAGDYGRIDVLLNNAGFGVFELLEDTPLERFEAMMDTNYMGIVRCTKAVLPVMKAQGEGHIVNVASMAGKLSTAKASGYAATKHAVLGFTNAIRPELAGMRIAVTAINPGPIDTPFLKSADPSGDYFNRLKGFMLQPEQVSAAIVKAIRKRTPEVDLPWTASVGIRIYGLFPRMADRLAGRWLNRK
ncbi:SDR family NAD(P)-dependent oxidoreductase [Paenibacillus sacheonensis]|uniref:SDR family NAD(P)-dependent oxidoreductase n=1 Tax=Paenibacillus sacheonensis TaxID=742054 RepID=A0A7X4YUF5_9BACL|nr:SDR family oxidoreductase [Paenibacillus sacheonensis]MBM7566755.1 short-subunit dehydrogenase [Paenibacillus sacheonensis]NBC71669.1 SDR family NAD(P)-dependent oxidoreductase [Paenibacillus sacheonensis]